MMIVEINGQKVASNDDELTLKLLKDNWRWVWKTDYDLTFMPMIIPFEREMGKKNYTFCMRASLCYKVIVYTCMWEKS